MVYWGKPYSTIPSKQASTETNGRSIRTHQNGHWIIRLSLLGSKRHWACLLHLWIQRCSKWIISVMQARKPLYFRDWRWLWVSCCFILHWWGKLFVCAWGMWWVSSARIEELLRYAKYFGNKYVNWVLVGSLFLHPGLIIVDHILFCFCNKLY